jgi:hypothetical protein
MVAMHAVITNSDALTIRRNHALADARSADILDMRFSPLHRQGRSKMHA